MRKFRTLLFSTILITLLLFPASDTFSQSDKSLIKEWLVLGSFPSDTIQYAIKKPFIEQEAGQMPKNGQKDMLSAYTWQTAQVNAAGQLNFLELGFPFNENCAAYAATYIYSPTERNANILLGSDDGVVLWLNEKRIFEKFIFRGVRRADDKIPIRLPAGWSRLLAKVINGSGGFGLIADIVDENDKTFDDIVFSVKKPSDFHPILTNAYAYIKEMSLQPSYVEKDQRYFPFKISLVNLGKKGDFPGRIIFEARRMAPKRQTFTLSGSTDVEFIVPAYEMKRMMGKKVGILVFLQGKKNDDAIIKISPAMVLQSLFRSRDLPEELEAQKPFFENIKQNEHWYKKFTGKSVDVNDPLLIQSLNLALNNKWTAFIKSIQKNYNDLLEFSHVIKQDTLHMIGQSHIDMAWLWRKQETIDVCRRTFQSAINFFDEVPGYKYIQSSAAAFAWMEEKYPDLFRQMQEQVQAGRFFIVGGMWVEPDLNLIGGEALVRQFLYGKRYFQQKFGVNCITGYTPDTFGYTWSLPQILKKAGFKYFVTTKIRWNDTTKFPYSIFHWLSPDGSDILTCFPMALNDDCNLDENANHLIAYKKEGFSDLPVLFGVGDHGGGPTRQNFQRIKEMQSLTDYPTAYYDDLDSYMQDVGKKYPDVPTYKNELYLEYHRGTLTTHGLIKKRNRKSEIALEEAEKFSTFSGVDYPKQKLDNAWKMTLFNQFHDILPGSAIPAVYADANKDYDQVDKITSQVIDEALNAIVGKIKLKGKGLPVVVFNPLSWQRSGGVSVTVDAGYSVKEVKDNDGNKVNFQQNGNKVFFFAANIPQMGYRTFWLRKGRPKNKSKIIVNKTMLDNDFFHIEINPKNGNIHSFIDKTLKRQVLASGKEGNVLQFLQDKPKQYDAWNIGYTGKSWTCDSVAQIQIIENGPARGIVRYVRKFGKSTFTQDYIIYSDIPRLDIRTYADWHEHHILAKAAFPVNVNADYATYEMAYGTIERTTHPKTPAEKAKFEVPAHKFVDLSQQDFGVALLNDSKYGHDIKDNVIRITLLRSPITPRPINPPEGYQAPYADMGKHEFVCSIFPHQGNCKQAGSIKRGYEFNYPLLAVKAKKQDGSLKQEGSFIQVSADNVILTVAKQAEDSQAQIIRLYEIYGKKSPVTIKMSKPVQKVWTVDLMEKKGKEIPITNNSISFEIEPFEIYSLMIE